MIKMDETYKGKHGYWYQLGYKNGNYQVWANTTQTIRQDFTVCSKIGTPEGKKEAEVFMGKLLDVSEPNAILDT